MPEALSWEPGRMLEWEMPQESHGKAEQGYKKEAARRRYGDPGYEHCLPHYEDLRKK